MSLPLRSLALVSFLGLAFGLHAQPQAEGRQIGYAVSMAEDGDFLASVAVAQTACMSTVLISFPWSEVRPDASTWDTTLFVNLDLINLYFASIGVKLDLNLQPVNTMVDELPADLVGLAYDDPLVVAAMLETLDSIFAHLPDVELAALNISNESDALWGTNASRYTEFGALLQAVKPHAKALYAASHNGDTLSVGTTFTWGGLTDPAIAPLCQITNAAADHISATYYGIQNDFTVGPPGVVIAGLDLLVAMQPGTQPIRLAEIGYPSGALCNSSEALQSQFVDSAFAAWDQHLDRIKYMGWFLTTDLDSATVAALGLYYGITAPVFLEFLGTLGLRTWPGSGTDKLAYGTLLCALEARGFCSTPCTQGLPERSLPALVIAPNPAQDRISINAPAAKAGGTVQFLAMDGRCMLVLPLGPTMDISSLPAGTYAVVMEGHAPCRLVIMGR